MAGEKARSMARAGEEALTEALRQAEESGELRYLHGRLLDLSDDSPDWFIHRLLRNEGHSLPLIERGKDIDAAGRAAEAIIERLRRRRVWLSSPEARCTPDAARRFNEAREQALARYQEDLSALNRAILAYNLAAPAPLHRRGIVVAGAVARAAREIPPLDVAAAPSAVPAPQPPTVPRLRAIWRRLRRADRRGDAAQGRHL